MALFKPKSDEERIVIDFLFERVYPEINLRLAAAGKLMALELEGERRRAFLRAYPRMAKKSLKLVAMRKDLTKHKEIKK